jgi:hypothetical protein
MTNLDKVFARLFKLSLTHTALATSPPLRCLINAANSCFVRLLLSCPLNFACVRRGPGRRAEDIACRR